jgi:uncharacterized protein (DUF433 family)
VRACLSETPRRPIRMVREGMSVGGLVKAFSLSRRYVRACLSEALKGISVGKPGKAHLSGRYVKTAMF